MEEAPCPLYLRAQELNWAYYRLLPHFSTTFFSSTGVRMAKENHTIKNEFILTGFTDHPELKTLLFVVFLTIFLITMVGQPWPGDTDFKRASSSHTDVSFWETSALVDSCCACAVTPKMLRNFFWKTE